MDLFGNQVLEEISIAKAAEIAEVSTATINNWIKVGSIVKTRRGYLDLKAFRKYLDKNVGEIKLTSRANKRNKDYHDHDGLTNRMFSILKQKDVSLDGIGAYYEAELSDSYRNKEGIYYTPQDIVESMFRNIATDPGAKSFCDPSCGSGNFIIQALKHGFKPERVYGFDTDPVAVEIGVVA